MTLFPMTPSTVLDEIAKSLDITPSDFERARKAIRGVRTWLIDGHPDAYDGSPEEPEIYLQGSMALGTVTRPLEEDAEADFDVDLVAELSALKAAIAASTVKSQIGDRLRGSDTYARMLEEEGKRCWTLRYAETGKIGFHVDVLPCVHESTDVVAAIARDLEDRGKDPKLAEPAIAITDLDGGAYGFGTSNPLGYRSWFEMRNRDAFRLFAGAERKRLLAEAAGLYGSERDVPDELVRTPLQRAIQILKRHRDIRFSTNGEGKYRPISMIITTLAAQIYAGERDLAEVLRKFVDRLEAHAVLREGLSARASLAEEDIVIERRGGTWYIPNPVNPGENFADKWHRDGGARADAFFRWVRWLRTDLLDLIAATSDGQRLRKLLRERMLERKRFPVDLDVPAKATPIVPAVASTAGAARPWGR